MRSLTKTEKSRSNSKQPDDPESEQFGDQPGFEPTHEVCFACGESEAGLHLQFRVRSDGSVSAEWLSSNHYQGYNGIIHGGIVSTLLDAAMTNCLFAKGIEAVTADLHVRFRSSVRVGKKVEVSARLVESNRAVYTLESVLKQDDIIAAVGKAKFMKQRSGQHRNVHKDSDGSF